MTKKSDGIQSDKLLNHLIAKFNPQMGNSTKYPILVDKYGKEAIEIARKIAEKVKNIIDENICFTHEQKIQFESNLVEAAKKINNKRPMPNIFNATKNILGFSPRNMEKLKENVKNMISNTVHGPNNITNHGIQTEAHILADEITSNIELMRGKCENCLQILCSWNSQN